jgi:hypothetical protein
VELADGSGAAVGFGEQLLAGRLGGGAGGAGDLEQLGDPLVGQGLDAAGTGVCVWQSHDVGSWGGGPLVVRLSLVPVKGCSSMKLFGVAVGALDPFLEAGAFDAPLAAAADLSAGPCSAPGRRPGPR